MNANQALNLGALVVAATLLACQKNSDTSSTPSAVPVHGQAILPLSATTVAVKTSEAARPAAVVAAPAPKAEESIGDYLSIGFDRLASFTYEMPDESPAAVTNQIAAPVKEQIPPNVKALNQRRIALKGFMLPLKVEKGLVTELLIMRDQSMCCYGTTPRITKWVSVRMSNTGVKPIMDQPVTIFGKLQVGEIRENGYLVGIYQMDGDKMGEPAAL